jgi:transposase
VAKSEQYQGIPTKLNCKQFEQFVLPYLSTGGRGPAPKLSLHAIFNYILQQLYMGCQWKELPIERIGRAAPKYITRGFIAPFEDGKPMAVLTPFSPIRYRLFVTQIFSTRPSFMGMGRQRRRRKVATTLGSAATRK